jgi:predicted transcriptional regulator
MTREAAGLLGPLESEVMEVVWRATGAVSVRAVLDGVNESRKSPLAYTTVMTVMTRLAEKDVLRRVKDGRGYLYEPAVSDEAGIAVRDVLRDFGDSALAHFVEEARADPRLMKRLERLMREKR